MKTYLLLRNNKQTGPYTATCLLQMDLQEFDLIWAEGESITWKYPSEMAEFRKAAPKAGFTEATLVNSRKEKQILYFDAHIAEMEYKKVNIECIQEPDAVLCDVAPGYEYLVRAQHFRLPVYDLDNEAAATNDAQQEAVDAANAILNHSYNVLGSEQIIDTPEHKADLHGCTTVWTVRAKNEQVISRNAGLNKKSNIFRGGLNAIMMGLLTLASSGYMNFKL
ncbi:hypothetical protein [Agriterribacter sp.]|uniref:hypothetical protein n=1 Tax=Agriterribacter sp. TaxID=2821509 RepID=UPI002D107F18|nr:hypothetical protein [Agriterribacter sp.]HRP56584.1 hypothetical protein [Agriterribacter sp.]